jgi:hypothetical protein
MAPKRAIYGDLSSAHASIRSRRGNEFPPPLNLNFPLPPTPVAQSPGSSAFDSPALSSESHAATSPFTERKPANESRFSSSLRQLTRSLTQRFSKVTEKPHEEELQEFSESRVSLASASFEGDFPRPLERSYRDMTPKSSMFSHEPITPVSPLDRAVNVMNQQNSPASVEQPLHSTQRVFSAPLTSMVPDPSDEVGQAEDARPYASESDLVARPYYEDLASLYPSSSIYTSESRRQSNVAPSRSSNRKSNPYRWDMGGATNALADEYKSEALLQYPSSQRTSHRVSRPLEEEMFDRSLYVEREKTDTISKFIDQYQGNDLNASQPLSYGTGLEEHAHQPAPSELYSDAARSKRAGTTGLASGFSQFQFGFQQPGVSNDYRTSVPSVEVGRATFDTHPGAPPSVPAPLAPAFQYDADFASPMISGPSDTSSQVPSYGNTRVLLGYSEPVIDPQGYMQQEPMTSSSYSQLGASSTPPEALEQAEEIFANANNQQRSGAIPAMWSKRVSGHNLQRSKSKNVLNDEQEQQELEEPSELIGYEDEESADWETMGHGSPHRGLRVSVGESLADYSSSERTHSSRDSMGFSDTFPVYEDPPLEPGTFRYRHPPLLRNHSNPFTSSPPPLQSSPPASSTVPAFHGRSPNAYNNSPSPQQKYLPFKPWTSPYEMSEKLTQELLASGPNDEILYEGDEEDAGQDVSFGSSDDSMPMQPMRITLPSSNTMDGASSHRSIPHERQNSFDKFMIVGPKGNLTGTPQGTGMNDAGSSVADNSSPGAILDSSPLASPTREHSGYRMFRSAATRNANVRPDVKIGLNIDTPSAGSGDPGFHEASGRRGNVNRDTPRVHTPPDLYERTPSQATLHPEPPFAGPPDRRASRFSLRSPVTPRDPGRRGSRAAVPGQTKLRHMVLAPSAATLSSSDHSGNDSRVFGTEHSARPSTSNTHTPLRHPASRPTLRTVLANEDSPHLLCPERAIDPVEEEARRKLSWAIFAFFCVLPPALILYRWMGDTVIVNVTQGRFSHVSPQPKRLALGVGIAVNVSITTAILLPILIAHAAGTL